MSLFGGFLSCLHDIRLILLDESYLLWVKNAVLH